MKIFQGLNLLVYHILCYILREYGHILTNVCILYVTFFRNAFLFPMPWRRLTHTLFGRLSRLCGVNALCSYLIEFVFI